MLAWVLWTVLFTLDVVMFKKDYHKKEWLN